MSSASELNGTVSNSSSLHKSGSCSACGEKAECRCERCGDFYCSIECQTRDWPGHRYICFPMPKLVKGGQGLVTEKDIPKLAAKGNNSSSNSPKSAEPKKNANQLPNGSCVYLTAFKSSNRCFVRSTNPSSIAERQEVLNEIDNFGKSASAFTSKPKKDVDALALRDDKWCRAHIIPWKDDVFKVFFTDFGDRCNKSLKELRKIIPTINNLPRHIQMVQLKGITNFSSNQKLIGLLSQFTNKEYKIEYSEADQMGGNVELFKWGSSISLNSLIHELSIKNNDQNSVDNKSAVSVPCNGEVLKTHLLEKKENGNYKNKHAEGTFSSSNNTGKTSNLNEALQQTEKQISQPTKPVEKKTDNTQNRKVSSMPRQVQMQKPCLVPPFEIIPMNADATGSQILILDNSFLEMGFIGCLLEKYCENLKAITEFLNNYKCSDEPYKPIFEEYCIAKFDNSWYRAKVVEILSENKFLVVYIDFTNEAELSSDSIRRYPLQLDFACCTALCGIDGLPDEYSKELKECLLEELKPFSTLKVDGTRMDGNICYLKSNQLLKSLNDSNLI